MSPKVVYTDLGKEDLLQKKVYLVCQIVRLGRMDPKDQDKKGVTLDLRRPFGVAVKEVSPILVDKQNEGKGWCD
jgi:dedicator of cytokinesis protein 2